VRVAPEMTGFHGGITPFDQGSIPQVGNDGTLYIAYEASVCATLNCDNPADHDAIVVATSKNGGKTFKNVEVALDLENASVFAFEDARVDREAAVVLPAFGPREVRARRAIRREVNDLDDVVLLQDRGEIIEREREAAVHDLPRRRPALRSGQGRVIDDAVHRTGQPNRREHAARGADRDERHVTARELGLARPTVEAPVAQGGRLHHVVGRRDGRGLGRRWSDQREHQRYGPHVHCESEITPVPYSGYNLMDS